MALRPSGECDRSPATPPALTERWGDHRAIAAAPGEQGPYPQQVTDLALPLVGQETTYQAISSTGCRMMVRVRSGASDGALR